MIPRSLIDRLFEQISNRDLVDKWNYPVQAANEFFELIKSGKNLLPGIPFLKSSRFATYNNLSPEELHTILYPSFQDAQELAILSLLHDFDSFIYKLKAQIQTVHARAIYNNGHPLEDIGRHIVSAAVFGFCEEKGYVYGKEKFDGNRNIIGSLCRPRGAYVFSIILNFHPARLLIQKFKRISWFYSRRL